MRPQVTLIFTVLDEATSIDRLLASVRGQTRRPDEIVVVDGGSRDGTPERIRALAAAGPDRPALPLRLLDLPGANISQGRNAAIGAATGALIAATDAGVRLDPDWLKYLIAPFEQPDPPDVVSGFFVPDLPDPDRRAGDRPIFQTALAATTLPEEGDLDPERFLPSSRSIAFRREAWDAVAGYPEWLDYCEDLIFDLHLRALGFRFQFEPRARVYFAPRESWRAFFRQYYRYARGDGKADLWRRRHAIRYTTYLGGLLGLWLTRRRPALWALPAVLGAAYCRRPVERYRRLSAGWPAVDRARGLALIPAIRFWGDLAKMLGYPVGTWWRLRWSDEATGRGSRRGCASSDRPNQAGWPGER